MHHFPDISRIDGFAYKPAEFFESLRFATEVSRDVFAEVGMVASDRLRGSGRAYVQGASPHLLAFLAEGGWSPLPPHEAVGLPVGLWFIEDPVDLPRDGSLMLAHWTAKSYADDLELFFGRRGDTRVPDGTFFTRSVVRQPEAWVEEPDGQAIVQHIVSAGYLWLGSKVPLVTAGRLRTLVKHELARLNDARAMAGASLIPVPSISTVRRRMIELNDWHGWPGGRVRGWVDSGEGFNLP